MKWIQNKLNLKEDMKDNLTFEEFCSEYCDRMYEPRLSYNDQATGYKLLRTILLENITPATLEETNRYRTNPTLEEFMFEPPLKYLLFLHENLRTYIRENWNYIKTLKLEDYERL